MPKRRFVALTSRFNLNGSWDGINEATADEIIFQMDRERYEELITALANEENVLIDYPLVSGKPAPTAAAYLTKASSKPISLTIIMHPNGEIYELVVQVDRNL